MHKYLQKWRLRRFAVLLTVVLGTLHVTGCARDNAQAAEQHLIERGHRIFIGSESINARIDGHQDQLPAQVTKCINCHTPTPRPQKDDQFAPILNASWLMQARPRRGGPAFAFTRDSLCKTMRTGIDPEYVILNRTMPRFDISEQQCQALWAYLSVKPVNEEK